jgi:hypothetical protein
MAAYTCVLLGLNGTVESVIGDYQSTPVEAPLGRDSG